MLYIFKLGVFVTSFKFIILSMSSLIIVLYICFFSSEFNPNKLVP